MRGGVWQVWRGVARWVKGRQADSDKSMPGVKRIATRGRARARECSRLCHTVVTSAGCVRVSHVNLALRGPFVSFAPCPRAPLQPVSISTRPSSPDMPQRCDSAAPRHVKRAELPLLLLLLLLRPAPPSPTAHSNRYHDNVPPLYSSECTAQNLRDS